METKENLKERLKHQVMERMDISRTMEDEEILELVQKTLEEDSHRMPMSISMRQNLIREIFHSLRRLDILQDLIEDADITEIMVNGTKGIFYEKAGRLYQWDKHFTSEEKLQDVIQQIAGGSNRMVNELHPIVDTRLAGWLPGKYCLKTYCHRWNSVVHPPFSQRACPDADTDRMGFYFNGSGRFFKASGMCRL